MALVIYAVLFYGPAQHQISVLATCGRSMYLLFFHDDDDDDDGDANAICIKRPARRRTYMSRDAAA